MLYNKKVIKKIVELGKVYRKKMQIKYLILLNQNENENEASKRKSNNIQIQMKYCH